MLVYGGMHDEFVRDVAELADGSIVAPDLASEAGATLLVGPPDRVESFRRTGVPNAISKHHAARSVHADGGSPNLATWILFHSDNEVARSLCCALFGHPFCTKMSDPKNVDDLISCVRMIDFINASDDCPDVAERNRILAPMGKLSLLWSAPHLVWPKIERLTTESPSIANLAQLDNVYQQCLSVVQETGN